MSDALLVTCPSCGSSLKLKSRNAIGKRVPCPKCKEPFLVEAPGAEDEEPEFLTESESDEEFAASASDDDSSQARPVVSRQSPRPKPRKAGSSPNILKPVLVGTAALALLALIGGAGYLVVAFIGSGVRNKIDLSYLPPDCDLMVHARIDEACTSPLGKSILESPAVKKALDGWATQYDVAVGDIKSVTVGLSGAGNLAPAAVMPIPGMPAGGGFGMPGMGAGRPAGANASGVIVIRTTKTIPADFGRKFPAYVAVEHRGTTYYRPPPQAGAPPMAVYAPAADVIVVADEPQMQRIVDNGSTQTRRAEFDFIETGPHIVIAMLNKSGDASTSGAPAGPSAASSGMGMPGMAGKGMPGRGMGGMSPTGGMPMLPGGGLPGFGAAPGADVPSLQGGKLKAWSLGMTFTQDLEIQVGLYCPESAKDARGELEASISKSKADFAKTKGQLGMLVLLGLGDLVPPIEQTVSSLSVGGSGSVVHVNARVPGSVKAALEKAGSGMAGMMAGGAPGGLGAGLGGGPGGGLPPSFGNGPTSLGDEASPEDTPAPAEAGKPEHEKSSRPEPQAAKPEPEAAKPEPQAAKPQRRTAKAKRRPAKPQPQASQPKEAVVDNLPAEPAQETATSASSPAPKAAPAAPVPPSAVSPLVIGAEAPDFELRDIAGKRVSLSRLQGKPAVLVFWATWSGPSKEVLPRLQDWHDKYGDQGLTVLAINATEDGIKASKLLKEKSYSFRCAVADAKTSGDYHVSALPLAVLIGSDGKIVHAVVGSNAQAYEALGGMIAENIKQPAR